MFSSTYHRLLRIFGDEILQPKEHKNMCHDLLKVIEDNFLVVIIIITNPGSGSGYNYIPFYPPLCICTPKMMYVGCGFYSE